MSISSVLSLFGWSFGPFPVPVEIKSAVERRRGQGRPVGRRGTRLALGGAEHGRSLPPTEAIGKPSRARRASFGLLFFIVGLAHGGMPMAHVASGDQTIAAAIDEASRRFDLPQSWIRIVLKQESGGRVRAMSPKGAMGLMQLMPSTWSALSAELALGDDPFEPRANILAGSAYLRQMYDRFGSPGFLAAYNAGPTRYERYLAGLAALPAETRDYVGRLAPKIYAGGTPSMPPGSPDWRGSSLFVSPESSLVWRSAGP